MADLVDIGKADQLQEGIMKKVMVGDHEVLLALAEGHFYAADNRCPHMGGDLSHGTLEGTVVTCPRHGSQFDLKDGHVIRWTRWTGVVSAAARMLKSPRPIRIHPIQVEEDRLLLSFED